ncbi:MAG: prepilin-type N-terminal cleavage/methylation domain-containing protein [Syntrophales bacterium]|jgi:Tfp pilus assembly protein PilV
MSSLPYNNRGVSLVEILIAIFLTTIGVLALMSLQPSAWRAASRSDYLGRAAEMLSKQLEAQQTLIMATCNTISAPTTTTTNYFASGQSTSSGSGDAQYSVKTTITQLGTNTWNVTVKVSWYNGTRSITGSMVVSRQSYFGC